MESKPNQIYPKLKPCPFCGSDKVEAVGYGAPTYITYRVECSNCNAIGQYVRSYTKDYDSAIIEASNYWNEREE